MAKATSKTKKESPKKEAPKSNPTTVLLEPYFEDGKIKVKKTIA